MKAIFSKPVIKISLVAIASAAIGGSIVAAALSYTEHQKTPLKTPKISDLIKVHKEFQKNFDKFFEGSTLDDDFFRAKSIEKNFEKNILTTDLDVDSKFPSGDIIRHEDDDFVYYDIKINDLNSTAVNTNIKNGLLTITASTEARNESNQENKGHVESYSKSMVNRSFLLPENVDQNKMKTSASKDKVILKFPKIKKDNQKQEA